MDSLTPYRQRILTLFSLLFLFSLVWALWPFITNPTSVTDAYRSAGVFAPLVFLVLVAVAPTPGAIVGASGVQYFGQWQGMLLLYVGNVLAVILTFAIVRWFGRPAIERFLEPSKFAKADAFLARHPFLLWFVYAVPVFPLEIITAVVALSNRKLRQFIIIPLLALPIDAFIVTSIGGLLSDSFFVYVEYASIAVVIVVIYAITHFLYRWKREELAEAGKRVVAGVTAGARGVGKAAAGVTVAVGKAGVDASRATGNALVSVTRRTSEAIRSRRSRGPRR